MSNLISRIALSTYGFAGHVFLPLSGLFLFSRVRKGKEDAARIRERYGQTSLSPNGRQVIWVHAASLGETNAVLPLIRRIVEMNFEVIFTTVTVSAARKAEVELPKGAVHQFSPLDLKPYVTRFLDHWSPSLAIFVESELWPTTMTQLAQRRIPQIIVNGRMSKRSFKRWKMFRSVTHSLFDNLALCLTQSEEDAERYRELGAHAVVHTGNMKFDTEPPSVDMGRLAQLQAAIGSRPVWLAASTHEREELIVAKAHLLLKEKIPNILTIIVPRHPQRCESICKVLADNGIKMARRSEGALPAIDTDIYIGDTFGEMGLFYRLAPCSLVGGSLVPRGGQNPIEPARLGSAIIYGPNVSNFAAIFQALDAQGGGCCVRNTQELVDHVAAILGDGQKKREMNDNAQVVLKKFSGALERTHQVLLPYLNPLIVSSILADASANRSPGE